MTRKSINISVNGSHKNGSLEGFEHRMPKQLSGGQQRVALARAMIIQPKLLLLDESLSALDKKLRTEMQIELRQIQKKSGITTIFVTDDQDEAMTMSDKIALMNNGKIDQLDTPQNIYMNPVNTFVANFLGKSNSFVGTIIEVDDDMYLLKLSNEDIVKIPSKREMEVGQKYTVIVRPEKMHLSSTKTEHSVRGTIDLSTRPGVFQSIKWRLLDKNSLFKGKTRPINGYTQSEKTFG